MFASFDRLFTTAPLPLSIRDLQFAVQDILHTNASLVYPSRWRERLLLDDLLHHCLDGRHLGDSWASGANDWTGGGLKNTAGSTSEELRFTTSNLGLALGNIALAFDECLGPLSQDNPFRQSPAADSFTRRSIISPCRKFYPFFKTNQAESKRFCPDFTT